jgi:DNA invertase Pin-like site-specific DNA recombinase
LVLLSIKYLLCSVRISAFQPYGSVPLVMRFKSILTSPGIPIWRFKSHGYELVAEYYDAAISGADPIGERPGFQEMLKHITGNSVRHILVESPDRFARDLAVQLAGHDFLKGLGVTLVPASAPDFFIEDTPTAVLVRQVLGAIAQFEKASTVAKLRAARDRRRKANGKCEGRKSHAEAQPELVVEAE